MLGSLPAGLLGAYTVCSAIRPFHSLPVCDASMRLRRLVDNHLPRCGRISCSPGSLTGYCKHLPQTGAGGCGKPKEGQDPERWQ